MNKLNFLLVVFTIVLSQSTAIAGRPVDTKQSVINEFCSGGWRNIANFNRFLERFDAQQAFHSEYQRILLIEGSQNNIRLPDEAAWKIARYLGLRNDNQYAWAAEITCSDWKATFR